MHWMRIFITWIPLFHYLTQFTGRNVQDIISACLFRLEIRQGKAEGEDEWFTNHVSNNIPPVVIVWLLYTMYQWHTKTAEVMQIQTNKHKTKKKKRLTKHSWYSRRFLASSLGLLFLKKRGMVQPVVPPDCPACCPLKGLKGGLRGGLRSNHTFCSICQWSTLVRNENYFVWEQMKMKLSMQKHHLEFRHTCQTDLTIDTGLSLLPNMIQPV